MSNVYGQDSITSLKGPDRVRLRPSVIFGSNDITGCTHSIFEIISNSVDEAREGYGDVIEIDYKSDGEITVKDNGRGMPLDWNEKENQFNWYLIFCEMYAGGKYAQEGSYGDSLGLNGLGACSTQFASEYMDVVAYREGYKYSISFRKGNPCSELKKEKTDSERTGTIIRFKPDLEVFEEIIVDPAVIHDMVRRQSMLNENLKFIVKYEGLKEITWLYREGTKEFLEKLLGDKKISDVHRFKGEDRGKDREDKEEYRVKMELSLAFSRDVKVVELYHNSSWLERGGSPDSALRRAIVRAFDQELKSRNKYNKNDSKITYKDVEELLSCIISTACPGTITSYENQTKKAITNKFVGEALDKFVYESTLRALREDANGDKILETALIYKRSREAQEQFRQKTIKNLTAAADNALTRPEKFSDCRSKDLDKRELYIVEGDSAKGSCMLARDAEYQAVMPIRGKIKNCLKADIKSILESEIITDLIKILGCGAEIEEKLPKQLKEISNFSLEKTRWGKIIICTDADEDGWQIRCLVLTMLYRMVPSLLKAGKVYVVLSPLYEIEYKNKSEFAYSNEERDEIVERLNNQGISKVKVHRSKGLGENEPEMMRLTTMSPDSRKLIQVIYDEEKAELVHQIFTSLLGDDIESRKIMITEYAKIVHGYTVL